MLRISLTPVVKQILIGCLVMFIGTMLLESHPQYDLFRIFAMHYPSNPEFKPWQIVTHMFMHGSFSHIAFNMLGLLSFGNVLERVMGSKKFVQLYFLAGLGAIILHTAISVFRMYRISGLWLPDWDDLGLSQIGDRIVSDGMFIRSSEDIQSVFRIFHSPLVGASGALYGIVVAFAVLFPNTELMFLLIPYPIKAKYLIPAIIGLDLFFGFSDFRWDPVAHFAHLGGAVTGLIMIWWWRKRDRRNFW